MTGQRKRYSAELKTRVALEAIKGHKTANEIAAEYGVHQTQIAQWKKQALDGLPNVFSTRSKRATEKRRGVDCHALPTHRPTESAGGLVGKKITSTALKPNERSLSRGILN